LEKGFMSQPQSNNPFLSRQNSTEIYLIRHADALPDEADVVPGRSYDDQPLSAKGKAQANALAKRWSSIRFDALYSSPLRRTLETAEPLATIQNLEIVPAPGVREIQIGPKHMMLSEDMDAASTARALRERLDRIIQMAAMMGSWDAVETAEKSADFRQRVVSAVDELALRHIGQRIAIISHGGAINIYIAEVLGISRDFFFPCGNTSVTILRVFQPQPGNLARVLVSLNELSHLRDAGLLQEN
jgi:broad specificity phosphatase PhoE